ncbi:MAG: hypothetical protein RL662_1122 [Bacteroidota bacterium]|jgi:antitoxin component YwqK of YwqJK toxin-antitoxin module
MINGYNVKELELLQDDFGAWYYLLNNIPYTGYAYALFPNGKLSYEYNLIDGYQEGIQRIWFENGQLMSETYYMNNIPNGCCSEWFENGVLQFEAEYNMGKKKWSKRYNKQGKLINEYK